MRLPTDFLFGVTGVRVGYERGRLSVALPTRLVHDRRYVLARVNCEGSRSERVDVELLHQEPFRGPVTGRNGWQEKTTPYAGCPSTRTLEARDANLHGGTDPGALAKLRDWGEAGHSRVLVRVTPEGFQLRVYRFAHQAQAVSCSPYYDRPEGMDASRAHGLLSAIGYGARRVEPLYRVQDEVGFASTLEYGATTGRWRSPFGGPDRHFRHPMCRSRLVENVTQALAADIHVHLTDHIPSEEGTAMTTDTTTNDTLPFGLTAGAKIVQVQFTQGSSEYAYFDGGLDLQVGDFAVVASPYGDSSGGVYDEECGGYLKVVQVSSVDPNVEGVRKVAKWIVSKVDVTDYRARRKKVEDLKALDARIVAAEREARKALEMTKLRELSPELAALIDAREALTKG